MRLLTTTLIAAVALATGACGGKNKKETTTVDTPVASADNDEAPAPEPEIDETVEDQAPAPELQQTIYFEFDSSMLSQQARNELAENAKWLEADATRRLTIEGHTDEQGTTEYNLGLGERRARAARDYLVRLGIAPNRIEIITFGEERPASEIDEQNRRSVFVATK